MITTSSPDFEVGIIGGGPAGAALAGYLGKAGLSCIVFERALMPRPHVGESFVPATTRVLRELDFIDEMEKAKFPHKFGAVWTANSKSQAYHHEWEDLPLDNFTDIRFEERAQEGVDRRYTYHVDRGKFDCMFLQHAEKLGADVYEGIGVTKVDLDADPTPRVYFTMGRKEMSVSVNMVVDCSGRQTLLGKQLRLKVMDPCFNQFAYHTWFDRFDRASGVAADKGDYIYVHFLPITSSWIWQIPITDTVTSIGVVTQRQHFPKDAEGREAFFWNCIETRPDLYEKLRKAERVHPFKEEGDYSYSMSQICGDRFMLVGDAGRFVDPIFSSGVSIAMNSARTASHDILKAAAKGDWSKPNWDYFERRMRNGTRNWYEFIKCYYRLNVLFTMFIQDPRYRLDVLQLLQGDVWDEAEPPVLKKMRDIVASVEQNPNHVWHKLLGNLTAETMKPNF
jgi:flavin-dependent dehydrogenase